MNWLGLGLRLGPRIGLGLAKPKPKPKPKPRPRPKPRPSPHLEVGGVVVKAVQADEELMCGRLWLVRGGATQLRAAQVDGQGVIGGPPVGPATAGEPRRLLALELWLGLGLG